ncbi:MAG TPA: amino acid ABC transporter permease [Acidimicrobiales bacterium]|nr:amino acid ABC transporter permease [Acidimicrobiales bacterium]
MTAPVLADALGPRARRRALVASVVASLVILAGVLVFIERLQDSGQLEAGKWRPLVQWPVVKFFLGGLVNTIKAASTAMAIAVVVGGVFALARLARHRPQRWLGTLYVEFFRGLPLYVLILFCKFGLPRLDVRVSTFWALVIGLSLYNSSVLAEIFRAGILSLDRGQSEAASALGLGYWQSMLYVIVPQAVRRMVPAIVSQLVTLLKDTSLGVLIFYEELLRRARISAEFYQNTLQSLVVVAIVYIAVNSALSAVATRLETRQRRRYGAGRLRVTGLEDLALTEAKAGAAAAPERR